MRVRPPVLVAMCLGILALQCSSSDKKNSKYPDASSFCLGWAQAECSSSVLTACLATSKDKCVTLRQQACVAREVTPKQDAHLTYDATESEACIGKVSAAYADAKLTNDEEKALRSACQLVFSGPGEKGRVCEVDADCKQGEGLRCVVHFSSGADMDAGQATGTCQVPVATSPGASCSAPDARCVEGYHCGTSSHCDQDEPVSASCGNQDPCAEGLQCSTDSGESSCVEKPGVGTSCNADSDCASGYCAEGVKLCAMTYQLSQREPFCAPLHD